MQHNLHILIQGLAHLIFLLLQMHAFLTFRNSIYTEASNKTIFLIYHRNLHLLHVFTDIGP